MSDGMQRYWEFKKEYFDKVLFYRFGHYFFVYFKDAEACIKFADVVAMGCSHAAYFHQKLLNSNISALVDKGFKVCVCE